jgi:ligand-binding sensor domain-containing protein/serine phosphatase RsbU (regulator of sigma subunit)
VNFPDKVCSQTYFFDNYSTAQGFESKVFAIAQDPQHYVWLGTQTGVSKFDGNTFVAFSTEDGLSAGGVRVLFLDKDHTLWMGHEGGGITRFKGESFESVVMDTLRSNITSISQDSVGHIWITSELNGAFCIRNPKSPPEHLEYDHYLKGESLGDMVFNSLVTSSGELYFITNVGIKKYIATDNAFSTYAPEGMFTFFSTTVMFEDRQGNYWFGTHNGGLSKLDRKTNKFTFYDTRNGLASNFVTSITEDRQGNLWIGHWKDFTNKGGISRIEPNGHIKVFNTINGLHDDHIWAILEDFEGNLLIGTTDQGLDIFKGEKFLSFTAQDGLLHNQVNTIVEDHQGQIWLGTNEGISIVNWQKSPSISLQYTQSKDFIGTQIRFLKKDRNQNIWIGSDDQGIMLCQTSRKRFVAQPQINSWILYRITALEIGNEGHLWIGTLDGLVEWDIARDRYVATHTQSSGLTGNEIACLYTDSKGNLWIGSDKKKGLVRYRNGKFQRIESVKDIKPTCIAEDKDGKIWIGTESKGVLLLKGDSVKSYGINQGLLSNLVNVLLCDDQNNIFVASNRGLNRIDQHTGIIQSYTRRVGFTGIETKANAWLIDSRGNLWLGTANGAICCSLSKMNLDRADAPIVTLSEMRIKGLRTLMTERKKLSSNDNDLAFRYISISISNPEGISYQVMLEGLHDGWIDQKNETSIVFNKLPPGQYTFKVRAKNDRGLWSKEPATYSFRILAPFYQRGYFIVTVIVLVLASIVAIIRIRERSLIQEKRILEERVNERTQALSLANEELSMRNRDITDSITYAKRIQFAILPPEIPFENTFILFKPKDIVSGDFYWMNSVGGREFMIAVDCTGHGVPGAFMSFIGFTSLNKIIIEHGTYKPSEILDQLNEEVATNLHQKGEDIVNDGMDVALVCYNPANHVIEYAGAFNPLIVIRQGEIMEIKADRFSIGRSTGKEKTFTNHELTIQKGDSLFLFSDGYADQFGGEFGKKFKTSALRDLMVKISGLDTSRQKNILDSTFEKWRLNQDQIDDVLIIGRKF